MNFKSGVAELILALILLVFYLWETPVSSWIVVIAAILLIAHAGIHMKKAYGEKKKRK